LGRAGARRKRAVKNDASPRLGVFPTTTTPFSVCVSLQDVTIPIDHTTGTHRGFGIVEFEEPGDAEAAIANLDAGELLGRVLRVNHARPLAPRGGGGGGGNAWADADAWQEAADAAADASAAAHAEAAEAAAEAERAAAAAAVAAAGGGGGGVDDPMAAAAVGCAAQE